MAVDRLGNVLVADSNNGRAAKSFSRHQECSLGVIGTKGEGLGEFREPGDCGVAVRLEQQHLRFG